MRLGTGEALQTILFDIYHFFVKFFFCLRFPIGFIGMAGSAVLLSYITLSNELSTRTLQ